FEITICLTSASCATSWPSPRSSASRAQPCACIFRNPRSPSRSSRWSRTWVCLLERSKRQVKLTEPGRVFLEQARQILAKADEARSHVAAAAAGYSGHLRLAYTVSVSFHPALPRTLLRYGQIAPKVALKLVEMYSEPQFAALLADEIDAGFVRSEPVHAQD